MIKTLSELTPAQREFLMNLLKQVTVSAQDPKAVEVAGHVQAILKQLAS